MLTRFVALVAAIYITASGVSEARSQRRGGPAFSLHEPSVSEGLVQQCEKNWFTTKLDHFSRTKGPGGEESFDLRYYVCDGHYRNTTAGEPGPIFFYLGNESNVLLYLNATGLMWENAERFGATLIFAEHRYYGESLPFGKQTSKHMQWLSSEQALADYATLIDAHKMTHGLQDAPVIGFGGSYGGMLASWGRLKYPHIWAGAIAGSAPIWTFAGETPAMDPDFYAEGVTFDTTQAAGAEAGCTDALRKSWQALERLAVDRAGLEQISSSMRLCPGIELTSSDNVTDIRDWAASALDYMSMGNYPYTSSYMLNGNGELPAFPMRAACAGMMAVVHPWAATDTGVDTNVDVDAAVAAYTSTGGVTLAGEVASREGAQATLASAQLRGDGGTAWQRLGGDSAGARLPGGVDSYPGGDSELVEGLLAAVSVFYNYTRTETCFDPWAGVNEETAHDADYWGYQYCTEMFMPFGKNGVTDMYWAEPWDDEAARQACRDKWGVDPRVLWAQAEFGGRRLETLTNVVFSNGLLDPWHGGGVLEDLSPTVKAVVIAEGAHHLDLMFSQPDDPPSVTLARIVELQQISSWIAEYRVQAAERRAFRAEQEAS